MALRQPPQQEGLREQLGCPDNGQQQPDADIGHLPTLALEQHRFPVQGKGGLQQSQ